MVERIMKMDKKAIAEKYGLTWKGDFLESLSEKEKTAGYVTFNIPDPTDTTMKTVEEAWGWVTPEDRVKYDDNYYYGPLKVILCDDPVHYMGILVAGVEVEIWCNGKKRPILDPDWVEENLMFKKLEVEMKEKAEQAPPVGERAWRLHDDLITSDNMLDGFTFDDVILALHTCSTINEQSAVQVVRDIISQRLQDLEFLFDKNIDIIMAEAKKGREVA